jgi:acetate kinase
MKILVLNSGSSSIKFQLFNLEDLSVISHGIVEGIGEKKSHFLIEANGNTYTEEKQIPNHATGLETINKHINLKTLDGIGHRVVHGGEEFFKPVLINSKVIESIKKLSVLAPLHNPANLAGIEVAIKKTPNTPQVAVFDTAFHHSMPNYAYHYALPDEMYKKHHVRRYGFHGSSHQYVASIAAKLLNKPFEELNIITIHLGNGASIAAIKNGKSIDTSMGFTPLEGLIMGTRSGDLDPAIIFYLCQKLNLSITKIDTMLNKQSGLKGICGSNDMREILDLIKKGDKKASLALEMFIYRIKKYIGSYVAVIGKVDALIFTGGIGEHVPIVRQKVCQGLEDGLGIVIDLNKNLQNNSSKISLDNSKIKIFIIPTNEELFIAIESRSIIKKYLKTIVHK